MCLRVYQALSRLQSQECIFRPDPNRNFGVVAGGQGVLLVVLDDLQQKVLAVCPESLQVLQGKFLQWDALCFYSPRLQVYVLSTHRSD